MRIDLEVLHSFDLIIETSTRDNECNSECVKTREIKRRQERRQDEMTGEQETWNASTGRTTRVDRWSEARGPSTTNIHTPMQHPTECTQNLFGMESKRKFYDEIIKGHLNLKNCSSQADSRPVYTEGTSKGCNRRSRLVIHIQQLC